MRRALKFHDLNGETEVFEIDQFVTIDSLNAPVMSIEPIRGKEGKFRLVVNSSFQISTLTNIEIIREG